ncbi:hypothetical protein M885DRAFT_618513 [Pelagophyceae sp. CCMP2097]|nr:hypothetical protein M885DRAFT_618513 [Pelagophyceae sp. CCMP2097]
MPTSPSRDSFNLLAAWSSQSARDRRTAGIILPCSFLLAACAGCTNAVGMLGGLAEPGVAATGVTHLTGSATKIGIFFALAFMLGATVAGTLTPTGVFAIGNLPIYGTVLLIAAFALGGAVFAAEVHFDCVATVLAAAAAGAQNGIVTTASTCVVRTTHLTGIATDLSLLFGCALSRAAKREEQWLTPTELKKGKLLLMLALGYLCGAALGGLAMGRCGVKNARALLWPAAIQLALGLAAKASCCGARLKQRPAAPPKNSFDDAPVVQDMAYVVALPVRPLEAQDRLEDPSSPKSHSPKVAPAPLNEEGCSPIHKDRLPARISRSSRELRSTRRSLDTLDID